MVETELPVFLNMGVPYLKESPRASKLLVPKRERGGAFLQEQELSAITAKFEIVLTKLL